MEEERKWQETNTALQGTFGFDNNEKSRDTVWAVENKLERATVKTKCEGKLNKVNWGHIVTGPGGYIIMLIILNIQPPLFTIFFIVILKRI